MLPIFRYTYFLSVDAETDKKARHARNSLSDISGISFAGQTYKPHITVLHFDREEDDKAVIRQATSMLTNLQAIVLHISKIELFPSVTKDAIVYIFQNPEIVMQLQVKLSIAHPYKLIKSNTPHITIAKELPKMNPVIYDKLPDYSDHPVKCTSLRILKYLVSNPNGYSLVQEFLLK